MVSISFTDTLMIGKNKKLDLLAEFEFENDEFELIEEAKDEVYIKIERECRITPFVGMKQPTPLGGMLGYEAVLTIKHFGELVPNYRWEIFQNDTALAAGITNANGVYRDLPIPMPYGQSDAYSIRIFRPDLTINKDASECNTPTEANMRAAVIASIREFLLEEFSKKYSCQNGSDRRDTSYIDFSTMIRIDVPNGPIHIDVLYPIIHQNIQNDRFAEDPVVIIYITSGSTMSYKFSDVKVDITAPNYGQLLEVVENYLQEAMLLVCKPMPSMDD